MKNNLNFNDYTLERQQRIENYMKRMLQGADQKPAKLNTAIHYSVFNGGKRVRPLLVYAVGELLGVPLDTLDAPAAAVELIHCYSLVHDDLPAMDNSPLRRGKPTCHIAFGEATAILVGDALLAEAFVVLTEGLNDNNATNRLRMITTLGKACGTQGMAAGQSLDLDNCQKSLTLDELETVYQLKTAALMEASILLGALSFPKVTDTQLDLFSQLGKSLGLAFQIIDDILDVSQPSGLIGKPQGLDEQNEKVTYVSILGIAKARALAKAEMDKALSTVDILSADKSSALASLANTLLNRQF